MIEYILSYEKKNNVNLIFYGIEYFLRNLHFHYAQSDYWNDETKDFLRDCFIVIRKGTDKININQRFDDFEIDVGYTEMHLKTFTSALCFIGQIRLFKKLYLEGMYIE